MVLNLCYLIQHASHPSQLCIVRNSKKHSHTFLGKLCIPLNLSFHILLKRITLSQLVPAFSTRRWWGLNAVFYRNALCELSNAVQCQALFLIWVNRPKTKESCSKQLSINQQSLGVFVQAVKDTEFKWLAETKVWNVYISPALSFHFFNIHSISPLIKTTWALFFLPLLGANTTTCPRINGKMPANL